MASLLLKLGFFDQVKSQATGKKIPLQQICQGEEMASREEKESMLFYIVDLASKDQERISRLQWGCGGSKVPRLRPKRVRVIVSMNHPLLSFLFFGVKLGTLMGCIDPSVR